MKLPKTRTENLVVQHLKNETLTYDLVTHEAYCLNQTSTIVYNACNGVTTFAELRRKTGYPTGLIYLALDTLREKNLLAGNYQSIFEGVSRREAIKRVGLACAVALPVISGLVAPRVAHAASGLAQNNTQAGVGNACQNSGQCTSGLECNNSHGICCAPGINKLNILAPGQTYTTDGFDTVLRGSAVPDDGTNYCSSQVACCAGGNATGDCTYTPVNGGTPNPSLDNYFANCTCSCPA